MKRGIYIFILLLTMSSQAWAYGTVVLFNPLFRDSNMAGQLPVQYVDVDGENKTILPSGHYVEIYLPAGLHRIDIFGSWNDAGQMFDTYADSKQRGLAIRLQGLDVKDGQTLYFNTITGLRTDRKKFDKKLMARRALEPCSPVSLVAEVIESPKGDKKIQAPALSDVDRNIPVSPENNDKTFVVVFANEDYETVASVPFARNDGKSFAAYAHLTLGVPEKNIHVRENATLNHLRAEMSWLQMVCEAFEGEARVIIYYAGHGIPDESTKDAYLLPVDGLGTDCATGYKLDDLYAALGKMPAKHIVVFLDACFSGSTRNRTMLTTARGVALKVKKGQPTGNTIVFSAAQADETAYPANDEAHGLFTYFLLKKLQETKGNTTLQQLADYIITNVRRQAVILNAKSQTPAVNPAIGVADEWKDWKLK